jgi:hypothetical protein
MESIRNYIDGFHVDFLRERLANSHEIATKEWLSSGNGYSAEVPVQTIQYSFYMIGSYFVDRAVEAVMKAAMPASHIAFIRYNKRVLTRICGYEKSISS